MCSVENYLETLQSTIYFDTILTYKYVILKCYISKNYLIKDGAHLRNFFLNRIIWHYLEKIFTNILKCYCMHHIYVIY